MSTRLESTNGRPTGQTLGYVLLGGAGAMALGMFLPWLKLTAPILGTITKAAIDGDGKLLVVLAAAIGVGAYFYLTSRFVVGTRIVLGSAVVLSAGFMVFEFIDTLRRFGDLASSFSALKDNPFGAAIASAVSYGFDIGFYLAAIGTLLAVVATALILKDSFSSFAAAVHPGVPIAAGSTVPRVPVEATPLAP